MSDEGRGVASISNMLTMTRIHNGISSVAAMRRLVYFSIFDVVLLLNNNYYV